MAEGNETIVGSEDGVEQTALNVRAVAAALEAGETERLRSIVGGLRTPDLADVIEFLDPDERVRLIEALGQDFDFEVFPELDEGVRDQLSEDLPNELLARAVAALDTDDAAYLIGNLEHSDREEILSLLPPAERAAIERNLEYPEDTAGRLMQADCVAVPPYWTAAQVVDHMRDVDDLPERFSEIFVVDPSFRVLGSVDLSRLLRARRGERVEDFMDTDRHLVLTTEDQEEVARQFKRYNLMSAPVVDENQRLVGVITVDDVVDVIHDEAEDAIKTLAGIGDESLADSVLETVKSRIPWLVVNLVTAIVASFVIKAFDATIEQMVALAVLMPIVASIGGNAGTQTMTVTVRALATNKLGQINAPRVISREALVGFCNGLLLSVIMALVVFLWFGSSTLGAVIGAAMIVNLLVAALAGILIPLILERFDLDPAPASGVFVTAITDVTGFLAFLGLATLWLV